MDNIIIPSAPEVERHIIGACLTYENAFEVVKDLSPMDFYDATNRKVFLAMKSLYDSGNKVTIISVAGQCEQLRYTELSFSRLSDYTIDYHTTIDLTSCVATLKDKSRRRECIALSQAIQRSALDAGEPVDSVISKIQGALDTINDSSASTIIPVSNIVDAVRSEIADEESGVDNNIRIGFHFLDDSGGLHPSDLVCIGAYPAVGKSALTAKMAYNIAFGGVPVAYYSLEMPSTQIVKRLCSTISFVKSGFEEDCHPIEVGQAISNNPKRSPEQTKTMLETLDEIHKQPLYIVDFKNTLDEITASIGEHVRKAKVKVVFIDYIQNIRNTTKSLREEFLGECCKMLKATAKRYAISIVILTQLTQNPNKEDRRPHYYNAKGASSIYEGSDIFITLDRPEADNCGDDTSTGRPYEGKHSMVSTAGTAEIRICKNKNGMTGSYIIGFNAPYTNFYDLSELPQVTFPGRRL